MSKRQTGILLVLLALFSSACATLDSNLKEIYAAGYSSEECLAKANALIAHKELVYTSEEVYLGRYGPPRKMSKKRAEAKQHCSQGGEKIVTDRKGTDVLFDFPHQPDAGSFGVTGVLHSAPIVPFRKLKMK